MDYQKAYQQWMTDSYFDESIKEELKTIANDENEIKERFYKNLEFGTAGLRGIIGAGTNREYLHCKKSDTGTCKLYCEKWGKRPRSCNCL